MSLRNFLRKALRRTHNIVIKPYFLGSPELGRGKSGSVHEDKLQVTWNGKSTKRPVAVKRFHTAYFDEYGGIKRTVTPEQKRKRLIRVKRVWRELKNAGLPVPALYHPILRKKSPNYLSLVMTQLEHEHGKLITGHESQHGRPVLFRELSLGKDKKLIMDLAHDVATIHNLGYGFLYPDIWAYYKKGDSYERILLDLDDIKKSNPSTAAETNFNLFNLIEGEFGAGEYHYFIQEYKKARRTK